MCKWADFYCQEVIVPEGGQQRMPPAGVRNSVSNIYSISPRVCSYRNSAAGNSSLLETCKCLGKRALNETFPKGAHFTDVMLLAKISQKLHPAAWRSHAKIEVRLSGLLFFLVLGGKIRLIVLLRHGSRSGSGLRRCSGRRTG